SDQLHYLELRDLELSKRDLKLVTTLPNLRNLDLRLSVLPDTAMKQISQMPNLASLHLEQTNYNYELFSDLGSSSSLKKVYVGHDKPNLQILDHFRKSYPHITLIRQKVKDW
ncbi:MAG: hypothetical protein WCT03_23230, partial [Candidatus Obscuribacterales bacterium]